MDCRRIGVFLRLEMVVPLADQGCAIEARRKRCYLTGAATTFPPSVEAFKSGTARRLQRRLPWRGSFSFWQGCAKSSGPMP